MLKESLPNFPQIRHSKPTAAASSALVKTHLINLQMFSHQFPNKIALAVSASIQTLTLGIKTAIAAFLMRMSVSNWFHLLSAEMALPNKLASAEIKRSQLLNKNLLDLSSPAIALTLHPM
jgi:hypothetical protein